MSAFGQGLVGNANCGTANPLMQMAGQMQAMGSSIADARTYAGVDKGVMGGGVGGPSGASLASAMRPSAAGVDGSAFMHAYNQGPQHGPMASMPLHVQQQQHAAQQRAMAQMASARMMQPGPQQSRPLPSGPDFADQFMAMELQHKQQKEFEQIFAGGGGPQQQHGPDAWAMDFAAKEAQHRQQHMMQSQQHAMMRAQAAQHQHTSHWGRTGMAGGMMMGGGYASQMMGGGMYSQMQHHPMHMGPSSIAAQQRSSSVQIQEVPDSTAAGPQQAAPATAQADDEAEDNLYAEAATDNEFEEAYRNATGYGSQADWGSQYNAESQAAPAQESNMGGGMSKQMIDDLMNSDNPKWRNSKFLAFIDKISKGEIEFKDNQAIDKGPQPQRAAGSEEWAGEYAQNAAQLGAEWADQFSTQKHHPASWGDSASSSSVSASAQAAMAEGQNADASWLEDYAASGEADTEFRDFDWAAALAKAKESIPERKDPAYAFTDASANPSMGTDPALAFDRGVQLFREGKLKEAILAFESVVQAVPDHADAWSYLGEAQAHNEEENNAIAAFLKCVSIDPYNLKALLQLGVSYTNDLEESRALNYLKTWLQNNPDYQSAALTQAKQQADEFEQMYGSNKNNGMYSYDNNLHDDVTQMFLNALTLRPDDADLHTVLGVLYHISSDFDKAIESFKTAVKIRPDDAALWNKLGATQANSSRSSDAVFAYKRALQLRPAYVRTLANLAISYANQGMHEDAVRTYLTTLTHNPDANHVWSYLRISLSHLQRDDLVELSHKKDAQLFRPFFQF